ncbi:MAG: flagellar basal-body MS-ring/collar protein FliF [Vicinamibacterales bacterium]
MNPESLVAHVSRLWTSLSGRQIASLAAAFVAVVGVVAGSAYWVGAPSYTVLYTDLDPESAAAVVARLKAADTPYRLEQGGQTVLVPDTRLDELRLDLASQGLPAAGRIGFEIFDRTSFGTTEFLEHVNYRRGLEGELARTISTIAEVQNARVHIALAKDSLFAGSAEQAKASVVLRLRNQRPLAPATVAGIAGLVAASVESLRPESVVIVDTFGRPLSRTEEAADATTGTGAIERQQRIERELATKVVAMLEPVLGVGHVRVNVSAPLTFASEEQTEERWDPETVLRSRQTSSDTTIAASGRPGGLAGGVAGARANAPPEASTATPAAAVAPTPAQSGRTTETVNYEVSRTTTHTTSPGGRIARLSVAVLVDNVRAAGENGGAPTSTPRDPAEMERIQRLVAAAVGLDQTRGDQLTVENIAFDDVPGPSEPDVPAPWWRQVSPTVVSVLGMSIGEVLRWVMVFVLALVALLAILRPMVRAAMTPGLVATAPAGLPAARTVAELESEMQARVEAEAPVRRDPGRLPALTKRLAQQAEQKPEHVAQLVRAWIAQEDK